MYIYKKCLNKYIFYIYLIYKIFSPDAAHLYIQLYGLEMFIISYFESSCCMLSPPIPVVLKIVLCSGLCRIENYVKIDFNLQT